MKRSLCAVFVCLIAVGLTNVALAGNCGEAQVDPKATTNQILFLGTGDPTPDPDRQGPAFVIQTGGNTYLFDMGVGLMRQAAKYNANLNPPTAAFLSHLHTDHTLGLPDLIFTPWSGGASSVPTTPLCLYGPVGLQWMVTNLQNAYTQDICVRNVCERHGTAPFQEPIVNEINLPGTPKSGPTPLPRNGNAPTCIKCKQTCPDGANCICGAALPSASPQQVYEDGAVTVYAFLVRHGCWDQAYGYVLVTKTKPQKKIVYSGDTRYVPSMGVACNGCDVLIHELWWNQTVDPTQPDCNQYDECFHTPVKGLQKVFNEGKPKQLVVVHQVGTAGTIADLNITCADGTSNCITLAVDGGTIDLSKIH